MILLGVKGQSEQVKLGLDTFDDVSLDGSEGKSKVGRTLIGLLKIQCW